jgi:tRNA dimethylallyltransferase
MLQRLAAIDPDRAAKLAATDRRRLIRALEVFELTGRTISEHDALTRTLPPAFEALYVVLDYADRKSLYARIDTRVDRMCEEGLFEETQKLLMRGVPDSSTCMQAIGYRQAAMALRGEITREDAVSLIKQATRRYAKRQLTWFRRHEEALRFAPDRMTPEEMAVQIRQAFSQ